jgi:hypothetical protein
VWVGMDKIPCSGKKLTSQNDQSNGPYFSNQKNHPSHNGHVEIDLFKMVEWCFLHLFKLGIFLTKFTNKKNQSFSLQNVLFYIFVFKLSSLLKNNFI